MDDTEASPGEERGVSDDMISDEQEKEERRLAADEVSSSEGDEVDIEEMATEDEEELWRRAERDGFQREETDAVGKPDGFPREEDINTTSEVWSTPPHPQRDM